MFNSKCYFCNNFVVGHCKLNMHILDSNTRYTWADVLMVQEVVSRVTATVVGANSVVTDLITVVCTKYTLVVIWKSQKTYHAQTHTHALTITNMSITVQSITSSTATLIATNCVSTGLCTSAITSSTLIDICTWYKLTDTTIWCIIVFPHHYKCVHHLPSYNQHHMSSSSY